MHLYLAYRVAPARGVVGLRGMSGPHRGSKGDQIQNFLLRLDELLLEPLDLDFLALVLEDL